MYVIIHVRLVLNLKKTNYSQEFLDQCYISAKLWTKNIIQVKYFHLFFNK